MVLGIFNYIYMRNPFEGMFGGGNGDEMPKEPTKEGYEVKEITPDEEITMEMKDENGDGENNEKMAD